MTCLMTLEVKALAELPKLAPWVKVQARHEPEVDIVSLINPEAPEDGLGRRFRNSAAMIGPK